MKTKTTNLKRLVCQCHCREMMIAVFRPHLQRGWNLRMNLVHIRIRKTFCDQRLHGIPDCRFLLLRCHCKRLVGSAETMDRSSAMTKTMVKSILQRVVVRVNECTKTFKSRTSGGVGLRGGEGPRQSWQGYSMAASGGPAPHGKLGQWWNESCCTNI